MPQDFTQGTHKVYNTGPHVELIKWLDQLGVTVHYSEAFRREPANPNDRWIAAHVDGNQLDDHVKINWVYGHGTSKMIWAKLRPDQQLERDKTPVGTDYAWARLDACDIVAECDMLKPTLVNVGQLHSIVDVSETRTCYSFVLTHKATGTGLLWEHAVAIFKPWILS